MDECPGCGSDNHLDMSLDALIELTGSVESACAINTVQPKLTWSFGDGDNTKNKPKPNPTPKPVEIKPEPTFTRPRRTRKTVVYSPTSTPSDMDTEYQEYLEFKKNYEQDCEENN
jgi:hypothetical protein